MCLVDIFVINLLTRRDNNRLFQWTFVLIRKLLLQINVFLLYYWEVMYSM